MRPTHGRGLQSKLFVSISRRSCDADHPYQCSLTNASIPERRVPSATCRSGCPNARSVHLRHLIHVHEGCDLRCGLWVLRRPSHSARSSLAQQGVPQLAEAAGAEKVSSLSFLCLISQHANTVNSTILKGVPTNAQLTLTLLRVGEANKAPLPPPPHVNAPPPEEPVDVSEEHLRATGADYPLNATQAELDDAMSHDPTVAHQTGGADIDHAKGAKHGKKGSKVVGFFKSAVKGTVETALGADRLKAKVGSEHAKNRLGVIPKNPEEELSGPVDFSCRYHGKRGHVYISTKATIPCVSFSTSSKIAKTGSLTAEEEDLHPVWSIAVADIKELKKIGGLGWKAKLVVGWALDREIADGLEIVTRSGETWSLTAMVLRDELFNRLIAMGGQKWEAW